MMPPSLLAGEASVTAPPLDELVAGLQSSVRSERADARVRIHAWYREFCGHLLEMIKPENKSRFTKETRMHVARLLGDLRWEDAAPYLVMGLGEPEEPFVTSGVMSNFPGECGGALSSIGRPAIPSLIEVVLQSDSELMRRKSLSVLNRILGGKRRLLELLAKLGDREQSAQARANLEEARKHIEDLWKHLKDEDEPLY